MSIRSHIYFKTTSEGWIKFKQLNDKIEIESHKPLTCMNMNVDKTPTGFYKITGEELKWHITAPDVKNFMDIIKQLESLGLPFTFIRVGENYNNINIIKNHPSDTPYPIEEFEPMINVRDTDDKTYVRIIESGKELKS